MEGEAADRILSLEAELRGARGDAARRESEIAILARVAAGIHRLNDVGGILDVALDELLENLSLPAAWVFLGTERDGALELAASRGLSPAYLESVRASGLGDCLCRDAFRVGRPMQARNTHDCPRMPMILGGDTTAVSHACIPLDFGGERRGVLNVAASPGERFSETELLFLATLAHQVAVAIERATQQERESERDREAYALAGITRSLRDSPDGGPTLDSISLATLELLKCDRAVIFLGNDVSHLAVSHLAGLPHPELSLNQEVHLSNLGSSLQHRAIEEQRVLFVDDGSQEPCLHADLARRWEIGAAVVAPLIVEGRTHGLLVATDSKPRAWPADQRETAITLAAQAAVALEGRRLKEEVLKSARELERARARVALAEQSVLIGNIAAGLAHEIRNPLNSISLQLSIADRRIGKLPSDLGDELRGLVRIIRDEVKRLDSLVSDFLLLSRSRDLHREPSSLEAIADEAARVLAAAAEESGVRLLRRRLPDASPPLSLDRERMKQVLVNIIQNAIEAAPGAEVDVRSGVVEGRATVSIQDRGPGLPAGIDVFDLFVTTKAQGTGLGLPIARQIVADHGGEIEAANAPGGGTVFTVSFPLPRA
jgi:signal transduction histidine kinase